MQMLTDNPITKVTEDRFGFAAYSNILANTIIETDKLPFCIGIFGDWGTGKTSLMFMIKEWVEKQEHIKTIWFNPWKYDKKEELWNALIQTILYKIAKDGSGKKLKTKAKKLAKSTSWLLLKKGLSGLTAGVISPKEIEKIKNVIVKEDEIHYRHINYFEKDFEEIVNLYTQNGKLIVFIDDLDRCLPENAITVLESLKLFIGNAKCAFVIGMDHYIVEDGIKVRFGEKIRISGREYLEKIIQVPFFLPPVPFNKLRNALQVAKTADYSENVWGLVEYGLYNNPRKTQRFVNCFYLLREILSDSHVLRGGDQNSIVLDKDTQDFYLAKLLVFQMTFPDFYSHLQLHPENWKAFEDISSLEYQMEDIELPIFIKSLDTRKFWENEHLKIFINKTKFMTSPSDKVVSALMQAINLVSPVSSGTDSSANTITPTPTPIPTATLTN